MSTTINPSAFTYQNNEQVAATVTTDQPEIVEQAGAPVSAQSDLLPDDVPPAHDVHVHEVNAQPINTRGERVNVTHLDDAAFLEAAKPPVSISYMDDTSFASTQPKFNTIFPPVEFAESEPVAANVDGTDLRNVPTTNDVVSDQAPIQYDQIVQAHPVFNTLYEKAQQFMVDARDPNLFTNSANEIIERIRTMPRGEILSTHVVEETRSLIIGTGEGRNIYVSQHPNGRLEMRVQPEDQKIVEHLSHVSQVADEQLEAIVKYFTNPENTPQVDQQIIQSLTHNPDEVVWISEDGQEPLSANAPGEDFNDSPEDPPVM